MALETELSLELDRVISCPYPASLVNLAKHLAAADALTIRATIGQRPPCAITKLVSVVTTALPLWQYTVEILRSLSESPEFREKLLLKTPNLLDTLLSKAISSPHAFKEYMQVCVTLLSRALPHSVTLPASAQTFFLQVFEQATNTDNVDVSALKSLYLMLNGACKGLLNLLADEIRVDFDERLYGILRTHGKPKYSTTIQLCFGLTILMEHPEAFGNGKLPVASIFQWKTKSGKKLFGGETIDHIYKTISVNSTSVVWLTNEEEGVSDMEALDGIRIANRTLQFVEQQTRIRWATSRKTAPNILSKLPQKIQRKNMDSVVQLEALCFYAITAGTSRLSPELTAEYSSALCKVMSVADTCFLQECLSVSLPLFASQMQETDLRGILVMILESCVSLTSTLYMENLRMLCDELAKMIISCSQFRSRILATISSHGVSETIESFLQIDVDAEDNIAQFCPSYILKGRRGLFSATISMLLTTAFSNSPNPSLQESLGIALLKKQQHLPSVSSQCTHSMSTGNIPPVSLFQQECTQLSGAHLQDWRGCLQSELESQSHYQRDSVIRSVARICHDLESRCETVEAPLLQEKEKSSRLQKQVSDLEGKVHDLEIQQWDNNEHAKVLENEKEGLEREKEDIYTELELLKVEHNDASTTAEDSLRLARETLNDKEMQLRSTVLAHEEDISACTTEINELRQAKDDLADKLHHEQEEGRALTSKYSNLRTELYSTENDLKAERQTVIKQKENLCQQEREVATLQQQLKDTETDLSSVTERLDDLQIRHHELAQSSSEALEKLEEQYEVDLKIVTSKAEKEHAQLQEKLQNAMQQGKEVDEAYRDAQINLHQLQASVPPLEAKIQELEDACTIRDSEIEELRAENAEIRQLGNGMMAFANKMVQRKRKPNESIHDDIALRAPEGPQKISSTAMEYVVNAAFSSSDSPPSPDGSTPKRPKPRPQASFKVPAMRPLYSNKPTRTSKPTNKKSSSGKRLALGPLSPNRRHTTVGFDIPEGTGDHERQPSFSLSKRRGSLQDFDDQEFSMGSFLTSTPLFPVPGRISEDEPSTTEL